jgi:HPr kinase/phosphorylase
MLVHATTIDVAGLGVLIEGASGSGKSDLALRMIAGGALLVADDQTEVEIVGDTLRARSPKTISGLIEARGVGIVAAPIKAATTLRLAVALVSEPPERMPQQRTWSLPGGGGPLIPLIDVCAFEPSTTEKLRRALDSVPIA